MDPTLKTWLRRTAIGLVALAILYFAGKLLLAFIGRAIGVLMLLVNVLVVPAVFFVLGWFAYSLFLKRYYRAWHINRIRNARFLREVTERDNE